MKKIYIALFALLAVGSTFTACTEEEPFATVTENADGSKTVTYRGYNRGQYLDMEDVKTCATRTLEQLADSVSYRLMTR